MRNILALFMAIAGLVCIAVGGSVTLLHYLTYQK